MSELDDEKKFYDRFYTLLRDRDLMRVFDRWGAEAFRRSSVLEGFEKFIRAENFTGNVVVEIGTLKGLTALVLSRYFKRVVSIDIIDDPMRHEIADALNLNVEFVVVQNNAEKAEVINALEFDAAFVDGDHAHDTDFDFDLVKRCKRVLFHEAWAVQPAVMRKVLHLDGVVSRGKWALWTA